ncbi:hypothetical protein D9M71_757610 [compost metagenome]
MPQCQQLFEQDGDLHAIGGRHRIQLQRMLAHRQGLVVGGACDGAVDVGEFAAIGRLVSPDLGGNIGCLAHVTNLLVGNAKGKSVRSTAYLRQWRQGQNRARAVSFPGSMQAK